MRLAQTAATAADGLYERAAMFRGGETRVHGSELNCRVETPKAAIDDAAARWAAMVNGHG